MVTVESQMLKIGTKAPAFLLKNAIDGTDISLDKHTGEVGTLVFFICNHCPFVIHIRHHFNPLIEEYRDKGISFIAINANSTVTHPQDGPQHMKKLAEEMNWTFPYLFDESQEVAKAYKAACTPDFFLFDKDLKLYYRGQFDDSRPKTNIPVTGKDLKYALDSLLDGSSPPELQKPSLGCNIKWAPGNAPDYFSEYIEY